MAARCSAGAKAGVALHTALYVAGDALHVVDAVYTLRYEHESR